MDFASFILICVRRCGCSKFCIVIRKNVVEFFFLIDDEGYMMTDKGVVCQMSLIVGKLLKAKFYQSTTILNIFSRVFEMAKFEWLA